MVAAKLASPEAERLRGLVEEALGIADLDDRMRMVIVHRIGWGGVESRTQEGVGVLLDPQQPYSKDTVSDIEAAISARLSAVLKVRSRQSEVLEALQTDIQALLAIARDLAERVDALVR